jgi:hypothetical protein
MIKFLWNFIIFCIYFVGTMMSGLVSCQDKVFLIQAVPYDGGVELKKEEKNDTVEAFQCTVLYVQCRRQ